MANCVKPITEDNRPVAMVISPFASFPADAGQRRRALQTTKMLRDRGYRVVFALYAFEEKWRWSWDLQATDIMASDWDEFYVFPAHKVIGEKPRDGVLHSLDEWWEDEFETWLSALIRRRFFDLVVVHNVWLSKALTIFPPATTKVIDTHDLFHLRRGADELAANEFFCPSISDEWYGLSRADIVLAIQKSEAALMCDHIDAAIRFLPYIAPESPTQKIQEYICPDRVRFGFIGNGSIFNRRALQEIVTELKKCLALDPAPVELVLAGNVSNSLQDGEISALKLGWIEDETDFYDACDIVLSPIFAGTGMKVKSVDALARGKPALFSEHSAAGLPIPRDLIFETPFSLVQEMCAISHARPPLDMIQRRIKTAHSTHVNLAKQREESLFSTIDACSPIIEILLDGSDGNDSTFLRFLTVVGHLRWLTSFARVVILSNFPALQEIGEHLPPGVRVAILEKDQSRLGKTVFQLCPDLERPGRLSGEVQGVPLSLDGIAEPVSWEVAMRSCVSASIKKGTHTNTKVRCVTWGDLTNEIIQPNTPIIAIGNSLPDHISLFQLIQLTIDGEIEGLYWQSDHKQGQFVSTAVSLVGLFGVPVTEAIIGKIPPEFFRRQAREFGTAIHRWSVLKSVH